METLKYALIAVAALFIGALWVTNFTKIANGCPAGQVLIKSVYTYECISR
jgi:hypothetical protein